MAAVDAVASLDIRVPEVDVDWTRIANLAEVGGSCILPGFSGVGAKVVVAGECAVQFRCEKIYFHNPSPCLIHVFSSICSYYLYVCLFMRNIEGLICLFMRRKAVLTPPVYALKTSSNHMFLWKLPETGSAPEETVSWRPPPCRRVRQFGGYLTSRA